MKHLFTLAAFFVAISLFGQKKIVWFDAGLKAQYGAAGLYNAAISDSKDYDHNIGKGFSYGGKIGINFNWGGISIDVMKSSLKQDFKNFNSAPAAAINWEALDIYLLYRNAKNMGYFEIGPKISMINKVETKYSEITGETTSLYEKNLFSGVVGFGANILGNDGRFSGILGLRFEYAFNDFVKDHTTSSIAPLPSIYSGSTGNGSVYKASNIAFAGVVFELNWGIGYFGKAQCGARSKFIMF